MKQNKSNLVAVLALTGLMACSPMAMALDTNAPAKHSSPEAGGPPGGGPGEGMRPRPGGGLRAIAEKLNLSDEQKPKYQEALKGLRDVMGTLRDMTPDERKAKLKETFDGIDTKLKGFLTPDQYKIWETESAKIRAGRGPGGGPGGKRGGGPGGAPAGGADGSAPKSAN